MPANARQSQNVYPRCTRDAQRRVKAGNTTSLFAGIFSRSPLTDSNRRPPPYHALLSATGRNLRQPFSLGLAVSAPAAFATACYRLQPRGSIKAPHFVVSSGDDSSVSRHDRLLGLVASAAGSTSRTGSSPVTSTVGGVSRNYIAQLKNDAATHGLTVPTSNRVEWLRGGTSPETQGVSFDLSSDHGRTWSALGTGTRIAGLPAGQSGGWELNGLNLPTKGLVRGKARVNSGQYNGSSGLVEAVAAFPFNAPPAAPPVGQFAVQDQVTHDKYGLGRVIGVEDDTVLVIDFGSRQERITTPCTWKFVSSTMG